MSTCRVMFETVGCCAAWHNVALPTPCRPGRCQCEIPVIFNLSENVCMKV